VASTRKTSLLVPAGAIVLLALYRPRAVGRSLAALVLVLGVLVHVASPGALGSVVEQLEPGHFSNVLSTTDRTARYDAVAPDVLRHLLLGRGFQSYDPHKYRILDNEYLGLLITTGAVGVLAYVAIFAAIMGLAHAAIKDPAHPPDRTLPDAYAYADARRSSLALAAFASVGTVALASVLFDALSFPHVPYLLFFVAALIIALRERLPPPPARPRVRAASARPAAPRRAAQRPATPRTRRSPDAPARPTPARPAGV
jgi:O-antigen ligase